MLDRQHTLESRSIIDTPKPDWARLSSSSSTKRQYRKGENILLPDTLATGKGPGLLVIPDHGTVQGGVTIVNYLPDWTLDPLLVKLHNQALMSYSIKSLSHIKVLEKLLLLKIHQWDSPPVLKPSSRGLQGASGIYPYCIYPSRSNPVTS